MNLTKAVIEAMCSHALKEYPYECCGIVTGDSSSQAAHRCENIQNKLHVEDPERYPRDARTAYFIERKEFDKVISAAKAKGEDIVAFYHSHPEHEAFFSEEDFAAQTVFGAPEFPDALHIIISVIRGKINDVKCFKWDGDANKFIALPLSSCGLNTS